LGRVTVFVNKIGIGAEHINNLEAYEEKIVQIPWESVVKDNFVLNEDNQGL